MKCTNLEHKLVTGIIIKNKQYMLSNVI